MHQQANGPRAAVAVKTPASISTPRRDLPLVALATGWLPQAAARRAAKPIPTPRPWDGETISLKAFGIE